MISIITINYNNCSGLQKTIESVLSQQFASFQYIIIDGGSTDGSRAIIEKYNDRIDYWVSEKDNGIYHAMNKGIKKATGEYLLFLNSGDWFCKASTLSEFVKDVNGVDVIYGDWYHVYTNGQVKEDRFPDAVTFNFLAFEYSLPHQASLIKKELFSRIGLYDEQLKMVADWKFYLQAIFIEHCTYLHKQMFIVYYNKEGFSSKEENNLLQQEERSTVLKKNFSNLLYVKEEYEKLQFEMACYKKRLSNRIVDKLKRLKTTVVKGG